jgi:hypothetical protein
MNVQLLVAGALGLLAATVHGAAGEALVVRRLSPGTLPSSRFGGPQMTRTMIHVTWHITTVAFLTVGAGLLVAGAVLHGDAARAVGVLAAAASTGFAALAVVLGGAYRNFPRALLRHPAPVVLSLTAALAWWGAL